MKIRKLLLVSLLISLLPVSAHALDCDRNSKTMAANKAQFAKADAKLNEVWKKVKATLPAADFKAVLERQRGWPNYRDVMAAASAGGMPTEPKEAAACSDYYQYQADITESRTRFLQGLIAPVVSEQTNVAWSGVFNDSFGGSLMLNPMKDGLHFSLDVVRSEAFHTGRIAGVARINGTQAVYSTSTDDYSTEDEHDRLPVTVTFKRKGNLIVVEAKNAQNFGGMRAYFDSDYARIGVLSSADRAQIERAIAGEEE